MDGDAPPSNHAHPNFGREEPVEPWLTISRPRVRVLVVDDYAPALLALERLLPFLDCDVCTCEDPTQAEDAARDFLPDVVFVDLAMPGKDGLTVARELRRAGLAGQRLVALTSYGGAETRRRCREAGFDLFLQKPATAEEFRGVLDGVRGVP
jgi:CheY-like chemotaxis protein